MRALAACIVAFGLVASSAMAGAGGPGDKSPTVANTTSDPAGNSASSAAPTAASKSDAPAKAEASSMELELDQLRGLLESQAKQIQAQNDLLKQQQVKMSSLEAMVHLAAPSAAITSVSASASSASANIGPAAQAPAAQAPPDLIKRIGDAEARLRAIGPFSFGGDFRLRDEPFFGGPLNDSQVRNRERYRLRFNVTAKLNNDIAGGFSFATGDPNDPITTNQTTNQFFTRHPFMLDRAFIVYTPHQFKPLTLTGGKMAYPWYRTELTWDNDINPEGLAQKLEWQSTKWHVLRQVALVGFELPFGETTQSTAVTSFNSSANALFPYPNASVHQSVVYGGQLQTRWQLMSWLTFTGDTAFYNWHNADPIALANQAPNASSPGLGVYKLNNSLTNSYQLTTVTYPVVTTNGPTTNVNTAIVGAKLNSKFALSDTIAQFDIKTASAAWPIRFLADYVQNTEACGNHPTVAPLTAGQVTALQAGGATVVNGGVAGSGLKNGVCNPHARRGTWLEARFGRQAQKGDWQFAYTHMLIDREAVMSLYDFSDMRQGSSVAQNRLEVFYEAHNNVQLGFTGLFGRPMGTTTATENMLKRLQFDVVYRF